MPLASGNHLECGICLQAFNHTPGPDKVEPMPVARIHMQKEDAMSQ
jgi:hypothetical protein